MMKIKSIIKKHRLSIIGAIVGGVGGYLYWYYVGCLSGTCPMKQLWYYNAILGALVGLFLADFIQTMINKRKKRKEKDEIN
ncbi:MAG: DUF6132 family protein [Bacteroidales bacterium]|jgi:uncharacterized membrane protein|nr:DUF6132 family protein [Bacteroidales bacterium]